MGGSDLAVGVLQKIAVGAVQNPGASPRERRRVTARLESLARRLDAHQLHGRIAQERVEDPDRIRASPDAGHDGVGKAPEALLALLPRLAADDRLEVADETRIRVRSDH